MINFLPTVHSRGNHNPSPRPESKNLAVRGFRSSNTGNVTGHSIVLVAGEPFPMVTEHLPLSAATCSCGGRESNPLILFPVIELPVFLVLPAGCNHHCNFSPNLVLSPMLLRLGMFLLCMEFNAGHSTCYYLMFACVCVYVSVYLCNHGSSGCRVQR